MAERFTQKGFEEDYDLLMGLAQILALLNLYNTETSLDCQEYLEVPSAPKGSAESKKTKKAIKKAALEDLVLSDTIASSTLSTVLAMLNPYMLKKGIMIGWHVKDEKYVLVYKGKVLDLKAVKEDDITSI